MVIASVTFILSLSNNCPIVFSIKIEYRPTIKIKRMGSNFKLFIIVYEYDVLAVL